jgi:hypothetical protein
MEVVEAAEYAYSWVDLELIQDWRVARTKLKLRLPAWHLRSFSKTYVYLTQAS